MGRSQRFLGRVGQVATHVALGTTHTLRRVGQNIRGFALRFYTPEAKGLDIGLFSVESDNLRYDNGVLLGLGRAARHAALMTRYGLGAYGAYPSDPGLGYAHSCSTDRCDTSDGSLPAGLVRPYQNSVATHHTPHTPEPCRVRVELWEPEHAAQVLARFGWTPEMAKDVLEAANG